MDIISVEDQGDRFAVLRRHNGVEGVHLFPKDALEWRAAEYEIDHYDFDTLLGIILYEPLLDDHSHLHPKHLYSAGSVAEARDFHLGRIRKLRNANPLNDPDDLLRRVVWPNHHMNDEAIDIKRRHVQHNRRVVTAERARRGADPEAARIDGLRNRLLPPQPKALRDPEAGLPPDTNATIRSMHRKDER
jgi:hypothetical protein